MKDTSGIFANMEHSSLKLYKTNAKGKDQKIGRISISSLKNNTQQKIVEHFDEGISKTTILEQHADVKLKETIIRDKKGQILFQSIEDLTTPKAGEIPPPEDITSIVTKPKKQHVCVIADWCLPPEKRNLSSKIDFMETIKNIEPNLQIKNEGGKLKQLLSNIKSNITNIFETIKI